MTVAVAATLRSVNGGLVIAGMLLLFQRHGYSHTAYADDLGLARDQHLHHHEDLERFNRGMGTSLKPPP
jgi:hypothetical protein